MPGFLRVLTQNVIVVRIKGHIVLLNIVVEFLSSEDLCNLDELVVVVLALEEGLLLEDHA